MEKIYIVYEPGNDCGYLMEDVYKHLNRKDGGLGDELEEKLETCETKEEKLNAIRQFVTLVDRTKYADEIRKMDAERYIKVKELILKVISENPGIRKNEVSLFGCIEYGDELKPIVELIKENLVKVSFMKFLNGPEKEITLYENIEKYKDIKEYDCYLTR